MDEGSGLNETGYFRGHFGALLIGMWSNEWHRSPEGFDLLVLGLQAALVLVADLGQLGGESLTLGFFLLAQGLSLLVGGRQLVALVLQTLDLDFVLVQTTHAILQLALGIRQVVCARGKQLPLSKSSQLCV